MTTTGYFAWQLADRGDRPCVRDDRTELTYREFADRVDAAAQHLQSLGVKRGDVVATFLPNRVELLVTIMAAWRLGAAATPVNPGFTATEADYQLDDANVRVVVGRTPGRSTTRVDVDPDDLPTTPDPAWIVPEEPAGEDVALIIYTSGSTGSPKGVEQTHANAAYMAAAVARHVEVDADDHALLILPLFHSNALYASFLPMMLVGGQLSITGAFSVSRFFADVATLRPTYFSAVPTIYALLTASPDIATADVSSLDFAICGAAPISKELLDAAESSLGVTIVEGYGLTEGTCVSACNPRNGVRKLGTVGVALDGQRIAVVDADGRPVPTGERGEVVISGPNVMRGYLHRPDATASTIIDGRLHTGDIGILDTDGYLSIVDRIKDMIIRGGENVYPKEIEAAIATHPAVLECAVVGGPHTILGEVPIAFVVAYPDTALDSADLADHLHAILTKAKRPTEIHLVDTLPRNPVGKIDKPSLRQRTRSAVDA
ncbi:long-chain-fatty-acid--CoA ligase [Gordonia spumicola]|uniref:Long-chain-fatty-acid--CoA ligase n=1 Tax=Gordonia spumicola TaxID=589161 RepID=A0A7I9VD60_9ACTN|nr:AMP-binding protein [Gordonia spumicola]GEE03234.1 long-chain-fatty-acid--CoA ligase [Gordonia spumicola]